MSLRPGFYYAIAGVPLMVAGVFGPDVFHLSQEAKVFAFYACLATAILLVILGSAKEYRTEAKSSSAPGRRRRMIAIAGMFVSGIAFLGFSVAYFRSVQPTKPGEIPISTSLLDIPGYQNCSGLMANFTENGKIRSYCFPMFDLNYVHIRNDADKPITLNIDLLIYEKNIHSDTLDGTGSNVFAEGVIGKNDQFSKLREAAGLEPISSYIISPLTIQAQGIVNGIIPFVFNSPNEGANAVLIKKFAHNLLKFKLRITDVIAGNYVIIDLPGQYKSSR